MFNKYKIPNYVIAMLSFSFELMFVILGSFIDLYYFIGAGAVYALAASYGGWIQFIGAKYHNAEGYTITAGFGLQIPFTQVLTIYFTYRFAKESK